MRFLTLLLLLIWGCGSGNSEINARKNGFEPAWSDARALKIANLVMQEAGDAYSQLAHSRISFQFTVETADSVRLATKYLWDVPGKRCQVSWEDADGTAYEANLDLSDHDAGNCMQNGKPVADSTQSRQLMGRAYASFLKDTYWLLAPHKLNDPGIILDYVGQMERDGRTNEVIKLSFDRVGLTPGNQYRLYVDPESWQIVHWDYYREPGANPVGFSWEDWHEQDGLRFSLTHRQTKSPNTIRIRDLQIESAYLNAGADSGESDLKAL